MGLEWNWRESSPCNLLIARRLSVDYTLLRSSISEKRPSSCDIRAALLRCIVCSHDDAVLVHAELLVPVRCCGSWAKLCARKLHKLVRRHARVVRTAVVRLGDECARLSFEAARRLLCTEPPASVWHIRCRLLLLTRWLLPNRVHGLVQDEWQGATRLRFKLRGLSAPPCAQCCARTRVRCTRLSIPACDENLHEMCELPNYGRVLVATGVMALWRRSGDGRALMTHALLAMERRTIHSCFPVGREESR